MTQYERELMTMLHHAHTPHPGTHECRVCNQPHPCDTNRACRPPANPEE